MKRPRTLWILGSAMTLLATIGAAAQSAPGNGAPGAGEEGSSLTITLENDSEAERAVRDRLRRLLREHPLERWIFTHDIVIDEGTRIPHSHPVLTLNTRVRDDTDLLSTFTHEQLHWWVDDRKAAAEAAIEDFRELFPEVPVRGGQGARSKYSSYLHLIVCDLEYQALEELVGDEAARRYLGEMSHYRWIYQQVLESPEVREVNTRHGLLVPEGP